MELRGTQFSNIGNRESETSSSWDLHIGPPPKTRHTLSYTQRDQNVRNTESTVSLSHFLFLYSTVNKTHTCIYNFILRYQYKEERSYDYVDNVDEHQRG